MPDTITDFAALRAPKEIIFGAGQRAALPAVVSRISTRALVIADPYLAESPDLTAMIDGLEEAGVTVSLHTDVVPELPIAGIEAAAEVGREMGAGVIVGIGGGSSIDLAKVAALLLAHGGPVTRWYGEFAVPGPTLPVVAVPTTAGTGSEVTPVAVVSDPSRAMKVGISSPHLIPVAAICDPELTVSCPPSVTLASGVDALSHCIESLTAVRRDADASLATSRVFVGKGTLTDDLAREGIRAIIANLPRTLEDPTNIRARSAVMLSALRAGLAFGTAGTAAAHALQYPVGAATHTPHGIGVGTLLPAVMAYNSAARVPEMAFIASVLGIEGSEEERAASAPAAMARYLHSIGIPASLADLGFPQDQLDWAAEQSLQSVRLAENNPVPLDAAGARRIIHAAFVGHTEFE